jgi:hypothetical protein
MVVIHRGFLTHRWCIHWGVEYENEQRIFDKILILFRQCSLMKKRGEYSRDTDLLNKYRLCFPEVMPSVRAQEIYCMYVYAVLPKFFAQAQCPGMMTEYSTAG